MLKSAQLLDKRTRPDFREVYGLHAALSDTLDAAVSRVRLGGMNLGDGELGGLRKIRLLVREMNALTLASEADSLAMDPLRQGQLRFLASLFGEGRLDVRIAPRGGWSPDFSVFSYSGQSGAADESGPHSPTLMIGHIGSSGHIRTPAQPSGSFSLAHRPFRRASGSRRPGSRATTFGDRSSLS